MRPTFFAVAAAAALLVPGAAHAQAVHPCMSAPCNVVFDWGNGGSQPDVDRRYGAPSQLEAEFIGGLQSAGFLISAPGQPTAMTITLRLTQQTRALCDAMPGTNPDYGCHTAQRGTIVFTPNDSTQKPISRIDVNPRCSDPKAYPTFPQFGKYAAQLLVFQLAMEGKGQRPSIKCVT